MEQHPVPQHIASFEFKLFGNLTVRQFVTLSIPMALAAAIYFSGLPSIVRFILSGAVGLFGLFAALVPIGGRPFDKWAVSFIKAILSPTQRVWTRETKLPEFLSVVVASPLSAASHVPESITAQGRERLRNYLRSLPKGEVAPLDVKEQIAITRLGLVPEETKEGRLPPPILWPTTPAGFAASSLPQIAKARPVSMAQTLPEEGAYEGKLEGSLPVISPTHAKAAPRITLAAKPYALPGLERKLRARHGEETIDLASASTRGEPQVKAQLASEANFTIENVIPIKTPGKQIKLIHGIGKTRARKLHFAPPVGFDLSKLPIRGERRFEISEELKKRFSAPLSDLFANEAVPFAQKAPLSQIHKSDSEAAAAKATAEPAAAIPKAAQIVPKPKVATTVAEGVAFKPEEKEILDSKITIVGRTTGGAWPQAAHGTAQIVPLTNTPNVISGIVATDDGAPIEKAILIIRDSHGIPVRALKTNKLGQFLSVTPLGDGTYSIEIEADFYKFKPFKIDLKDEVLLPMEVKPES